MALLKCKMCGGDLVLTPGSTVAECEYCGSKQTVPSVDSERKIVLFNRANRLRLAREFDKAAGIYEAIVADFPEEAEAYWGLVLCKYGIEYVDDPATARKIPTCHRSSFDSVMDDDDLEQALENAAPEARKVYRAEGKQIEELRKGIIEISSKEDPYDIFICYKETDEKGNRTLDSLLAQDVYDALTAKGYRTFFSRISLEDKLGQEYEPRIFAALNSARIMLAVGTDYEHYNAPWVKNEWSRFLRLMVSDPQKALIPCFKNIDAYDMPREFAKLQAQDLGKVGAIQDLLRGIEKILPPKSAVRATRVPNSESDRIATLLHRGNMALEDGLWGKADSFFEDVLSYDSKNARAYLGKALASEQCRTIEALIRQRQAAIPEAESERKTFTLEQVYKDHINAAIAKYQITNYLSANEIRRLYAFTDSYRSDLASLLQQREEAEAFWINQRNLSRAVQFSSGSVAGIIEQARRKVLEPLEAKIADSSKLDLLYLIRREKNARKALQTADSEAKALYDKGNQRRQDEYSQLIEQAESCVNPQDLRQIAKKFDRLTDYSDSSAQAVRCRERAQELQRKKDAQETWGMLSGCCVWIVIIAAIVLHFSIFRPSRRYREAEELLESGRQAEAMFMFHSAGSYSDAQARCLELWEQVAPHQTIAAGEKHSVALTEEGRVIAVGDNTDEGFELFSWPDITAFFRGKNVRMDGACAVEDWTDIVSVAAGSMYTAGLRSDGTVVVTGNNDHVWHKVKGWTDIVAIYGGYDDIFGLRSDGHVMAVGNNQYGELDVSEWTDIIAISSSHSHTVGLKADGTVLTAGHNNAARCNVSDWTDIIAVSAGRYHTAGLRSDGTVIVVGDDIYGQCDTAGWTDIVAIGAGDGYTLGLRADGTVMAVGTVSKFPGWNDIVAVSAGQTHVLGLKADATAITAGTCLFGQDGVDGWTHILIPE